MHVVACAEMAAEGENGGKTQPQGCWLSCAPLKAAASLCFSQGGLLVCPMVVVCQSSLRMGLSYMCAQHTEGS